MTAVFDSRSFALLDDLRRRHFPTALNHLRAHATLFHHLPGENLRTILDETAAIAAGTPPLPFATPGTLFLGRGVAFSIDAPDLVTLRAHLAKRWHPELVAQDRQPYRPHVTIQNKVAPDVARVTKAKLDALPPILGTLEGLAVWHYRGGPWEEAARFAFAG